MENTQQKVRHIPIFVEGRDEPIINKGHESSQNQTTSAPQNNSTSTSSSAFASADSSSSAPFENHQKHQSFGRPAPPMGFGSSDMGFGNDMHMPTGSIFDRAKDFPVRDFFNLRSASPRRSESPISVHHQTAPTQQQHQQQQTRKSPSPAQPQPKREQTPNNQQDQQIPVQHDGKRASSSQRQQTPTQQQQQEEEVTEPPKPTKQKAIEDSITKIQKIQTSVLNLMERVEKYDGRNRKEYAFLDEMLTQNLLKLDDIDAEGKESIKSARREAIKCINSLISLLEAKNDEAASSGEFKSETSESNAEVANPPTQNGLNGASKNSSYDNINVQQTSSNNSVNMVDAPLAEASLEAKVRAAMQKQQNQ